MRFQLVCVTLALVLATVAVARIPASEAGPGVGGPVDKASLDSKISKGMHSSAHPSSYVTHYGSHDRKHSGSKSGGKSGSSPTNGAAGGGGGGGGGDGGKSQPPSSSASSGDNGDASSNADSRTGHDAALATVHVPEWVHGAPCAMAGLALLFATVCFV